MEMFKKGIAIIFVFSQLSIYGQEAPAHSYRILPVGDPPPFVQEVRDGVRYEVAPRKGSLPPRELRVPCPSLEGSEDSQVIQPRLGRVSNPFVLPVMGENSRLTLVADDGSKWLSLGAKAAGNSLLLAWRAGKDWSEAAFLEIPQDRLDPQAATVHFANLTNQPVALVFGEERIRLNPGKHFSRTMKVNASAAPLEILVPDEEGKLVSIHANQIEPITPSYRVIAVYAADGVRPKHPVKVLSVEEIF